MPISNDIYAVICDEHGEGIVAARIGSMNMPLVCLDSKLAQEMYEAASLGGALGKSVCLVKFTNMQIIRRSHANTEN